MKSLSLLLLFASLGACRSHRVTYDTQYPRGQVSSEWTGHYFGGYLGHEEIDVRKICPQGVARIETYRSVGNGIVTGLTLGVYTPRTVDVTCISGQRAVAIVDAEKALELVASNATQGAQQ